MRAWPIGRMLSFSAALLLALAVLGGCNSTPSLPASLGQDKKRDADTAATNPKNVLVRPGMELTWSLKTDANQPGLVRSGAALVGPDGTMTIGPYGDCKVAGLTLAQAGSQVEKQLAAYVKQPHIELARVTAAPEPGSIVWKKAKPAPSAALAQNSWTPANPNDEPFRPVGFQTPATSVDGLGPLPTVTIKDKEEMFPSATLPDQPMSPAGLGFHRGHAAPGAVVPPPPGPSEMRPIVLPTYMIRSPDVLLIESQKGLLTQPIRGQHLVRPDGTVGVGIYGAVLVAGKTIAQARDDIAKAIYARLDQKVIKLEDVADGLSVDVLAYNSAVYYVITDGAGLGQQVYRFPVMGSETVLDAISNINGLPVVSSPKRIWVARRNTGTGAAYNIYPVDWQGITQQGAMNTNWQIMPGDRVFVQADPMRRFNNTLSKMLEPIERILGVTLLGAQTNNSIRGITPSVTR